MASTTHTYIHIACNSPGPINISTYFDKKKAPGGSSQQHPVKQDQEIHQVIPHVQSKIPSKVFTGNDDEYEPFHFTAKVHINPFKQEIITREKTNSQGKSIIAVSTNPSTNVFPYLHYRSLLDLGTPIIQHISMTCRQIYNMIIPSIYILNRVFDNSSALRYSAYLGSLESIKHGLAQGLHPSPSVWGGAGWYGCRSLRALTAYQDDLPALYWAAWWGNVEMAKALLQANADVNQIVTARRIAAATDDLLLCESLLAVLNEDAKLFGYSQSNDDMASALYLSLDAGHEPITHLLICDAKCNLVLNKTTMLHAIHKASRDCLINVMGTILCQSEKEAFARDISGHTALHHAMARPQNKTVEVIQALLKFKVKVNAKNSMGFTALDFGFAKMQQKCKSKSRTAFSRALQMWVKATLALVDGGGEFSVYSKEQVRNILPRGQWANCMKAFGDRKCRSVVPFSDVEPLVSCSSSFSGSSGSSSPPPVTDVLSPSSFISAGPATIVAKTLSSSCRKRQRQQTGGNMGVKKEEEGLEASAKAGTGTGTSTGMHTSIDPGITVTSTSNRGTGYTNTGHTMFLRPTVGRRHVPGAIRRRSHRYRAPVRNFGRQQNFDTDGSERPRKKQRIQ
ncbi:hypothetical protein CFIMG_003948RA [Ceratocystis fimbriata CBS 114723]|uniref:Uncharacterized protein n=1 Tax=Ceratocystis fimbriata CBS 114723 TaxID=1035309 RepID=A0A2C5X2L6_9PEZI|nr:hypothetical protein CFIMG_003948RA [Ceratocystis fimbriata CBS 114723]